MKKKVFLFLIIGLLYSIPNYAVKPIAAPVETTVNKKTSKKEVKQALKIQKKQKKIEKRFQKLEKRLSKKANAKGGRNVWDEDNFRLGAYIAIGGLLLRLLSFIPFLGGIISFIGALIFIVGLGIMVWVLIDG